MTAKAVYTLEGSKWLGFDKFVITLSLWVSYCFYAV